ncbi:nucleoporin p58/p45 [Kwoniella heveanensis CBS 569]|nr:nucleoporin p58/p45 [Kwoniella heveanensis CBS 569]
MSFGSFKFGNTSTAQPGAPSLSLTNPTPGATPTTGSAPFSFGNTGQSQPAAGAQAGTSTGGSLFGGLGSSSTQPAAGSAGGGSLFGNFGAKPAASTSTNGGGLFGGLGGAGAGQQQQQPQQQQQAGSTGTGLFSSTAQPGTSSGTGSFGSTAQPQQQQQQQQQQGGLFGSTAQPSQGATGGLFGSTTQPQQQQQQQTQQSGLFGSTTQGQSASTSLFGQAGQPQSSSLFGQTAPAQNNQSGNLQTSTNGAGSSGGINKTTRFADLPEATQKYIEQMDTAIKAQKAQASGGNIEGLGRAIWQTSLDVKAANEEYSAISHTLKSLGSSLTQLREKMINEGRDVERVKEIWDVYRSAEGRMGQVRLGAYRDFPQEFFAKIADQMEERVGRYKKTISQLNRAVVSLSSESHTPSPQAIAQTIQNHQQAMLALAAQLDGLQLRMNDLRAAFAEEWREKTGSVRDPFEVAREERAVKA